MPLLKICYPVNIALCATHDCFHISNSFLLSACCATYNLSVHVLYQYNISYVSVNSTGCLRYAFYSLLFSIYLWNLHLYVVYCILKKKLVVCFLKLMSLLCSSIHVCFYFSLKTCVQEHKKTKTSNTMKSLVGILY